MSDNQHYCQHQCRHSETSIRHFRH